MIGIDASGRAGVTSLLNTIVRVEPLWVMGLLCAVVGVMGPAQASKESVDEIAPPAAAEPVQDDLEGEPMRISMDFKDADLKDVLRTFSEQSGINVIATDEVGDRTVTLFLEEVTVMDALDRILDAAGLVCERSVDSEIYLVRPSPEISPTAESSTVTKVYRLKFARVSTSRLARAAEALGSKTPFEAAKQTSSLTSGGGSGSSGGGGGSTSLGSGGGEKEVGIDKVIEKILTKDGKVVVDERTNSLIVSEVPANFPRIEAVLKALDIRTAQILIDAELLETSVAKVKDLGVEWGNEGTVFGLTPAKRTTRFPFSTLFSQKTGSSTSVTLGTLDASQSTAALQALERDINTRILARPKVLTLDNESALIRLTTLQVVGFETTTGEQTSTTSVTPERMTTGVILVVTPQVNERGYITMLVEPSVTQVSTAKVTPPANAGTVVDPKTRSARAMVRIKQGETLVMGGLIDRTEEEITQKVPFLGDIPILGGAFRNKETDRSASELIVFVTPHILEEPEDAQLASSASQMPLVSREQEPATSRQAAIEQRLNALEREQTR